MTSIEEVILSHNADELYTRESMHRRRRCEWPTPNLPLLNRMRQGPVGSVSPALKQRGIDLITAAAAGCDFDMPYRSDGGILGIIEVRLDSRLEPLLVSLYERGRQQSAILDLFLLLCERNFMDATISLKANINFRLPHVDVERVVNLLCCFKEADLIYRPQTTKHFGDYFEAPIRWLAVMIVRSCADAPKLFQTIEFTGMLGKLIKPKLDALCTGGNVTFAPDPKACAGQSPSLFGFWLPSGVENEASIPDVIEKQLEQFNGVEVFCKEYFGLSDDELILEKRQDNRQYDS
ncbi:hypothetical protein AJ80_08692 [Polytolypa hystricis UAMH7299]|uniref:Uncharacterized protein n=1 Tax=Polytolypa hystricis (strain UAMH7299) TaxID=1447883 RepID=A0A2B7WVN8_POLH7|nr:hypothetical protein AJ80_08692 [Polytolypa hystricis UAMH7299]